MDRQQLHQVLLLRQDYWPGGETRAKQLLDNLGIRNVPVPVDRIAKALGAQVRFSPLDEELSVLICIKDSVPIIGINSLHHPNRQRFTIAHEIAHLQLHRSASRARCMLISGSPSQRCSATPHPRQERNSLKSRQTISPRLYLCQRRF